MLMALDKAIPWHDQYRHQEGPPPCQILSVGASVVVLIEDGNLILAPGNLCFL